MKPIAIVIPWFGKDQHGGAEQISWQVSSRLAERGHIIDVLTTCCRAFQEDWAVNHYEAGVRLEDGIVVKRFPVNSRDSLSFDQVNSLMLNLPSSSLKPGVSPVSSAQSAAFAKGNINSSALLNYLSKHKNDYEAFIFIPYLYGVILNGLPIVAERAFLQPCLHDEVYAYLPEVEHVFRVAKGLLFNSEGESCLAHRLYGPGIIRRSITVGLGVEVDLDYTGTKAGSLQTGHKRFVLCLGRKDPTKNTELLVNAYVQFKIKNPNSTLSLVLAGPGKTWNEACIEGLVDLGLVDKQKKAALLANCLALFQPSRNESYSRVMMEAWSFGRPVAAHRECLATANAVKQSQGGWMAETESEWAELFATIDCLDESELAKYGEKGRRYANENASWDMVIERYEEVLGLSVEPKKAPPQRSRKLKEVHQLLPNLAYGDAISNQALTLKEYLRSLGYESDILVQYLDGRVANEANLFNSNHVSAGAGLIFHYSIGSELTEFAMHHPGPKCLVYHNITPAEFFTPFRPDFARILKEGRAELSHLAQYFSLSVGDSAYNASELEACGFPNPGVLPIIVDPDKWNISADAELMETLQDGRTNLLFVGRLAPNKRQDQLIEAFAHYVRLDRDARLILVGCVEKEDPYYQHIIDTIERFGLEDDVVITGLTSSNQLLAYYRTAHLFWSMSEHEGFCVPAVEAMWFDVPVVAYKSAAIPETLGGAGAMFKSKDDLLSVAVFAKFLVSDESLRAKILAGQRKRRSSFLPEVVWPKLNMLLEEMEGIPRKVIRPKRVAFVVQRCGLEVNGGAETYCLRIAQRLSAYWDTEILTTCALDYTTWENHYSPGTEEIDDVKIRRFPIDEPRDVQSFNRVSESIYPRIKGASLAEQEAWMHAQGPWATELLAYVEQHKDEYDAFIFFSYLYATTYSILPKVEKKAYLVPLAHDEWPIQMNMWNGFFERPQGFIFNSPEEKDFLKARFPAARLKGPVAGMAVDPPEEYDAERFRQQYGIHDPFLLYVGRIDPSKGCEALFNDFIELRKRETHSRKLVLLGKAVMPIPDHEDIIALGFVDEQSKWDALAACDLLVMPSPYESLSIVLLEAWSAGRSVLVCAASDVLVGQCRRSQGGLWYSGFDEFFAAVNALDARVRTQLGERGKKFVQDNYSWSRIEKAFLDVVGGAE